MKMFAIICTREVKLGAVTNGLVSTLSSFGVVVKVIVKQSSIFEAYKRGLAICKAAPTDIIIFCHDDLQILSTKPQFIAALGKCVLDKEIGIIGPAGTTLLGSDAIWWNQERWQAGYHRGQVKHTSTVKHPRSGMTPAHDDIQITTTSYGPQGQVVVLDGLFLAARAEVWEDIGLSKPEYFKGEWDFYDLHYTSKAHLKGYKNYTIPIDMIHQSSGELVGRDSWHKNRQAFIANTNLPITI
jgi:GT2 family glycosyltransferase